MLIRPGQAPAEAVRLIFGDVPASQTEEIEFVGVTVPVASLRDLIVMTLNSFRLKDLLHLQTLDEAGLITTAVERELPPPLQERLRQARQRFAQDQPDVE